MPRYIALVPAAGSGARMGEEVPKQYLEVAGRPLLWYALSTLAGHPKIETVFAVLAHGDSRFNATCRGKLQIETLYCGGATRAASVYQGLLAMRDAVSPTDWVLVHDAARPCLTAAAIDRLIDEVGDDEAGGLLAVPVADTLKRADGERVAATESREGLWQAQTPQMFRYAVLVEALRRAGPSSVTDEAGAIEKLGLKPKLVMGETRNLKVTYMSDLAAASALLQ